jgi:DNA ligase D-like protein (predicted 3'-phosphoesterase)
MVHKHQATHLHYDLRIEIEGVLSSWALKELPTVAKPGVSAIRVADHPMWYRHFEGVIPEGTYGAGPVMVWDKGIYTNLTIDHTGRVIPVEQCLTKGILLVYLEGHKLNGTFALVKVSKKQRWILTQLDGFSKKKSQRYYRSVKSNKTLRQILAEDS